MTYDFRLGPSVAPVALPASAGRGGEDDGSGEPVTAAPTPTSAGFSRRGTVAGRRP